MSAPSAAATLDFLKEHPELDMAALFVESVRSLAEKSLPDTVDVTGFIARGMRDRITAKIGAVEENLEYIDFGIFAEEAARAMKPLKVAFRGENGAGIRVVLPVDIRRTAAEIADSWQEAGKIAAMMASCAANGGTAEILPESPDTSAKRKTGAVSCGRVEPPRRSKIWEACANILKRMLKTAKYMTLSVIAATAIIGGSIAAMKTGSCLMPTEHNRAASEIGDAFSVKRTPGILEPSHALQKQFENSIDDPAFIELAKSNRIIASHLERLKEKDGDRMAQARLVNYFWNYRMDGVNDIDNYGEREYWAKPSEMWKNQSGDCEDYAIAKYAMLRLCGFDRNDLFILATHAKDDGGGHAILAVRIDGEFMIMDNLHEDMITPAQAAREYTLNYAVNEKGLSHFRQTGEKPATAQVRLR